MPELQRPYLKCPTCGEMTALPYPNPEGKPSVHTEWPSATWKRNFLRLECDHACVYTKSNIHLRSVLPAGPKSTATYPSCSLRSTSMRQ